MQWDTPIYVSHFCFKSRVYWEYETIQRDAASHLNPYCDCFVSHLT